MIMLKVDEAKITSKTGFELIAKKQEFSFDQENLSFRESIPIVRKCLVWFNFHWWLYKIKKLSENSVMRINKINQDKISGNFFNSLYHRWKQI